MNLPSATLRQQRSSVLGLVTAFVVVLLLVQLWLLVEAQIKSFFHNVHDMTDFYYKVYLLNGLCRGGRYLRSAVPRP